MNRSPSQSRFRALARQTPLAHESLWFPTAVVAVAILMFGAVDARAQGERPRFELTPFAGYQLGGDFEVDDFDFGFIELEVEESELFGVYADIPFNQNLQFEIFIARQNADLQFDGSFFFPDETIGEVAIDVYHAGVLFQGSSGQFKPFVTLTGGVTSFDPDGGSNETYPSVAFGGGFKLEFSDNIGLRFDGRFLVTDLQEADDFDCCYNQQDDTLTQLLLTGGIQFRF